MVGEMPVTTVEQLTIKPGPTTIGADMSMITRMAELSGCSVTPRVGIYREDVRLGQDDFYDMAEYFGHGRRPRIAEQAWCGLIDVYVNDCLSPERENQLDYAIDPNLKELPSILDYGQFGELSVHSLFRYVSQVKEQMASYNGELPPDLHERLPNGFKGRVFALWGAIAQNKLNELSKSKGR